MVASRYDSVEIFLLETEFATVEQFIGIVIKPAVFEPWIHCRLNRPSKHDWSDFRASV